MPTHVVNTHEAKSRLSELIRAAESGDDVIVARNGEPVARIVAWAGEPPRRTPGIWRGRISIQSDLVAPDPADAELFGTDG